MTRATVLSAAGAFAAMGVSQQASAAEPAPGSGVSPDQGIERLGAGNRRFVAGSMTNQNGIAERRLALTGHQSPFVSLLSCSDSRVPTELVFDQHVGDLFVFRNAGNFVDPAVLGTLEYGYAALGVRLIVVLGHEGCGAVKATYEALEKNAPLPPNLDVIERAIREGIAPLVARKDTLAAAVVANALAQAAKLLESPVLGPAIRDGECKVVAAEYRLGSGRVTFLDHRIGR